MAKITESASPYRHLEQKSTFEILNEINNEDKTVAYAVEKAIPALIPLIEAIVEKLRHGGRLFYIGAGTSGRLGIVDASECPPTFGVPFDMVIGLIAGGDGAIRKAVEFAEDDPEQAWKDLQEYDINPKDVLVGIAASGSTPYVVQGLKMARENYITTASISCNPDALVSRYADFPIEVVTGPEYVTGSTRMKAGTAQKLILNMITTTTMIRLSRVLDNKMVDMQLTNNKLVDRGVLQVAERTGLDYESAKRLLLEQGSVRKAIDRYFML